MARLNENEHTVYVVDAITQTRPNEQLLERYLQTQSTISFFENMIVTPFEKFIKERGVGTIFEDDDIRIFGIIDTRISLHSFFNRQQRRASSPSGRDIRLSGLHLRGAVARV